MSVQKKQRILLVLILFWLPIIGGLAPRSSYHFEDKFSEKASLGQSLRQRGEFNKAITVFDEALRLASKQNNERSELDCLMQLGILYWNIGQLNDSTSFYKKAISLSSNLGQKDLEAECAAYIKIYEAYIRGKEACSSGLFKESIAHFNAAIDLARKMNSPEHELKCLRQMSLNYFQQKDHLNFYTMNSKALDIAKRLSHRKEEGRCLNNIGIFYYEIGQYSRALIFYDDALPVLREAVANEADLSACLNNIAGFVTK